MELGPDSDIEELRSIAGQPAPHFLLGPVLSNVGTASTAIAEVRLERDLVGLAVTGLDIDEGPATEVLVPLEGAAPTLPVEVHVLDRDGSTGPRHLLERARMFGAVARLAARMGCLVAGHRTLRCELARRGVSELD